MNTKNYAEALYRKIWITKGTRFLAYKRLETINELSNWAIALNSIYVIIASILTLNPFLGNIQICPEKLTLITIFFSMIILVLVLIENSKNYKGKANAMHQCGKDLNLQYEKLAQIKDQYELNIEAKKAIDLIGIQYVDIIGKYTENHLSIDHNLFIYSNKELYTNKVWAFLNRLCIWVYIRIAYIVAIFLPLFLLILFCMKRI